MIEPAHPSECIPAALADVIRGAAHKAEMLGSLCAEQLEVIYTQNWFNLFVPKALGGLELPLPEALAIEEALAWADGSTGWAVTLCSGANWFAGFLNPDTATVIFKHQKVCIAGSGQPSGIATITSGGYAITGKWKYATGAPHATAFTANCIMQENGIELQNDDGSPLVQSFIFMRDEVVINKDWHTTGMIATASHSFEVNNLSIPANRIFVIDAAHAVLKQPIYQYPFLQFAEATLAVNSAGMAARFIQLAAEIFNRRAVHKSFTAVALQAALQTASAATLQLNVTRQRFYAAVQSSWRYCVYNGIIDATLLNEVSAASRVLAATSLRTVDELYPFCGMATADNGTEINRVWRNLHTASQHSLLLPA